MRPGRRSGQKSLVWTRTGPEALGKLSDMPASAKETVTLLAMITRYLCAVVPLARREIERWERAAADIPDPALREHAVATLADEALLAEAAALFAAAAPASSRVEVVRVTVAFQVLYDYLDTLGERPECEPLDAGQQLYGLLDGAFLERGSGMDDGGYVDALAATCRSALSALPATLVALPGLLRATRRCASGQARTHAVAVAGAGPLAGWARDQDPAAECEWWEVAGGAISSLGVHALFAAAADPHLTAVDVERIDRAYFPWICALSTLLDCLIDRHGTDAHAARDNHSVLSYYVSDDVAAERVASIAARSALAAGELRSSAHLVIVAGVAAWYLSSREARRPENAAVAAAVRAALGPLVLPLLAILRVRRLVG